MRKCALPTEHRHEYINHNSHCCGAREWAAQRTHKQRGDARARCLARRRAGRSSFTRLCACMRSSFWLRLRGRACIARLIREAAGRMGVPKQRLWASSGASTAENSQL
eukprot:scaffold54209_cov57-Phaeocystis_antarctica.AAC.4